MQRELRKNGVENLEYRALTAIKGLSHAKASIILAGLELSRRYLLRDDQQYTLAEQIVHLVADIRDKKQEHLIAITLDGAQRLIAKRVITVGTLDSVLMHPREVFADAIVDRAAHVVVVHNHPSNTLEPSHQDIELNQQLATAARILGMQLMDHIIVTKHSFVSLKKEGFL